MEIFAAFILYAVLMVIVGYFFGFKDGFKNGRIEGKQELKADYIKKKSQMKKFVSKVKDHAYELNDTLRMSGRGNF